MEKFMAVPTIKKELRKYASLKKAKILQGFFKTGPGDYGQGDIFLGVMVPQIRTVAKLCQAIPLKEADQLLQSKFHEERLLALLVLILKFKKGNDEEKKEIYELYLARTRYVNNWDLVDLSAKHIVGAYLKERDKKPIYTLAVSNMLWERRIAILATFRYIEEGAFKEALALARILLNDKHDLIQKAVGWSLREIGKRNSTVEEEFLKKYYRRMPRTSLRYAIERFPIKERQAYLKGKV
jgi:3-methyladenine DNA glycosylase AlkD